MPYVATVNVPGYLPMDDDPPVFETAAEAWSYLLDEYSTSWNDVDIPGDPDAPLPDGLGIVYRETCAMLRRWATNDLVCDFEKVGSAYAPTPGREADDPHDLGLAYSVTEVSD